MAETERKSPNGQATNDLVFSAHMGTNDEIFPYIMSPYVEPGSTVADVTFGNGVFWRHIPQEAYSLRATDLADGIDCRELPYESGSIDCVVFDPPYMHTPGGTAHVNHQNYEGYYKNNRASSDKKYHGIFSEIRGGRLGPRQAPVIRTVVARGILQVPASKECQIGETLTCDEHAVRRRKADAGSPPDY